MSKAYIHPQEQHLWYGGSKGPENPMLLGGTCWSTGYKEEEEKGDKQESIEIISA